VRELVKKLAEKLSALPPVKIFEATYTPRAEQVSANTDEVSIEREGRDWFVEAPWLAHLVESTNFGDFESRNWLDKQLRQAGLFDKLEAMGIQDGDTVVMYGLQFEYER
jgi:GTP-binding protein